MLSKKAVGKLDKGKVPYLPASLSNGDVVFKSTGPLNKFLKPSAVLSCKSVNSLVKSCPYNFFTSS